MSVLTPVLDEERDIRHAVDNMRAQRFDGSIEFIFIDGRSEDRTREILEELGQEDDRIRVLDNPARLTPNGLNIGLGAARGEYVARMDAHTLYPTEYLASGVERLRAGGAEWVSGPQLARGNDKWSRRVALALSGPLGTGGARFRNAQEAEVEVDTGFTGIWRRDTLLRFGGWDEDWPVDQDYELAARMREAGQTIVCIPPMAAAYIPRNSIRRLWRQYWRYGVYRVKTSLRHPQSMRRSQVLPPGLALTVIASLAAPRPLRRPARAGLGLYGAALSAAAVRAASDGAPRLDAVSLPLVFVTMHLAAGLGFLRGCLLFGPPVTALLHLAGFKRRGRQTD